MKKKHKTKGIHFPDTNLIKKVEKYAEKRKRSFSYVTVEALEEKLERDTNSSN